MFCPACRSEYPDDWKACPKDATLLLKSSRIGKYNIEGLLGVGGMGAVYRASNPDTKGRVAVKVMNPAVAGAEQMRARFQREAAAVAALRTSHVTKVYDFGAEEDGTLYLVMELLDGHPLRDEIVPGPDYMDLARVQMVMDGALKGLAAAHRAGIVHRDLKPENIFVADTDDGEIPKLLDFGIARVRTRDSDLTRTGSLMGTASYMAPEQIASQVGEMGPWSDVYAMGAILYEMLAGTAAFGGDTVTDVLHAVLRGEVIPLQNVRAGLPESVYALVSRCMSPTPANRPQDAEQLRKALEQARLVPAGHAVPPPHRTKPPTSNIGLAATNATPQPGPPPGSAPQRPPLPVTQPSLPPNRPASQPQHTTAGASSGEIRPSEPPLDRPKRSKVPLAIGGVVLAGGIAAAVVVASSGGSGNTSSSASGSASGGSAVATVVVDGGAAVGVPPPGPDAAAVAVVVDAGVDPTAGMVVMSQGLHEIGKPKRKVPDALPYAAYLVSNGEQWIDREEMTVGKLRAALGAKLPDETAQKLANEPDTSPARFVDHATAVAACAALGKRLPSEAEWEIAARTTPQESKRARLNRTDKEADLIAPATDCSADGLCDMLGGLLEWTTTPWSGDSVVVRGASYRTKPDGHLDTIHARIGIPKSTRDNEIGFRCAYGSEPALASRGTIAPKPDPRKPDPAKQPPADKAPPDEPDEPTDGKCDLEGMKSRAKKRFSDGTYGLVLGIATRATTKCNSRDPELVSLGALAACKIGRATAAKTFYSLLPPARQTTVKAACAHNGIDL